MPPRRQPAQAADTLVASVASAPTPQPFPLPRPPNDAARTAAVEALLAATDPGDPVLSALCRLLRSVLDVPFASA